MKTEPVVQMASQRGIWTHTSAEQTIQQLGRLHL
jgi:hypothetical protein